MKILVLGAGKMGRLVAKALAEKEITFTVAKKDLRMWDYDGKPVEAAGMYEFFVGESSMAELTASIMVK